MKAKNVIPQSRVFEAISRERDYQDKKWGALAGRPMSIGDWLLVVEAELAEAKEGFVKTGMHEPALRELLQVAAVAVAAMQQLGVHEREGL